MSIALGDVAQLARACGSYPQGQWFESTHRHQSFLSIKVDKISRSHGQSVKTSPFHGGVSSSILLGITKQKKKLNLLLFLFFAHNSIMGYYSYHSKVMSKIKKGELSRFEFVDSYKDISPCLLLYFVDGSKYPIREHMFDEYIKLLGIF